MIRDELEKVEELDNLDGNIQETEEVDVFDQLLERINSLEFTFRQQKKIEFLTNVWKKSVQNNTSKTVSLYIAVMIGVIEREESNNKKEWMKFSEEQVDDAFINTESTSIITLQSYLTIIRDYLNATTPKSDVLLVGYEYTRSLTKKDLEDNGYLNLYAETHQFLTEKELDEIIQNGYADTQCKAIALLLYNGVRGEEFTDIANIRESDVDIENRIIRSLNGEIMYIIPTKYLWVFEDLLRRKYYYVYDVNGEIKKSAQYAHPEEGVEYTERPLFKRTKYGKNNSVLPIDMPLISKRITELAGSTKNQYLNPTSIYNAGLVYRLLQLHDFKPLSYAKLKEFRDAYDVKLSFVSMKRISKVLMDKKKKEDAPQ